MCVTPPTLSPDFLKMCFEVEKPSFNMENEKGKKAIVIAGPTGVGKSELALQLAQKIGGEIISADSVQVYKGLNIGTSKPSLEEQLLVPHHLVDILDLDQPFSAVDFQREALKALESVYARGKVPILVGGSGFYIRTLLFGSTLGPPPNQEFRKILEEEIDTKGIHFFYSKLSKLDPDYAMKISSSDRHKIVRALEIMEFSGKKVTDHVQSPLKVPHSFQFRCWFLTRPRGALYSRIEKRCERMVEIGLLEEIEAIIPRGLKDNKIAASAIGYRQGIEYLETDRSRECFLNFMKIFKTASRHYAKRQLTWFKKEANFQWIDIDLYDSRTAIDILLQDFESWLWEV